MTAGAPWLVTGGAGYIGSHVVAALLTSGKGAIVMDDLSAGQRSRVPEGVDFFHGSVRDVAFVQRVIRRTEPAGIIHLAGRKSPTESIADPLMYARENVGGVISLLEAAANTGLRRIVFSSSCSVYGNPDADDVDEDFPTIPVSPYGESKLYGERLLNAAASAHGLGVINLRYFNVIGAAQPHLRDTSTHNLVPLVLQALRAGDPVAVCGGDYPTADGTCVRDYVDVEDLADAHVRAADALDCERRVGTYNVSRGTGSSVLQVLEATALASGTSVRRQIVDRRPGDPACIVGRAERIRRELGWQPRRTLLDSIRNAWSAECRSHG